MTEWFVYILECADGTLYTGIAADVEKRIAAHAAGKGAKYARGRGPYKLLFQELHPDRGSASRREAEIKSLNTIKKRELIARAGI